MHSVMQGLSSFTIMGVAIPINVALRLASVNVIHQYDYDNHNNAAMLFKRGLLKMDIMGIRPTMLGMMHGVINGFQSGNVANG